MLSKPTWLLGKTAFPWFMAIVMSLVAAGVARDKLILCLECVERQRRLREMQYRARRLWSGARGGGVVPRQFSPGKERR